MIVEGDYAPAIGVFMRQYLEGKPLTVTGTGEQRRDFTYVGDIVNGIIRAAENNYRGDIFELGHGKNYSIKEVTFWFGSEVKYIEGRPGEAMETLRKNNSAADMLGWKPKMDLKFWIKNWIKENE